MTYEDATSRCWLEVDLDALRMNYRAAVGLMQENAIVIPVLKANAYGMGAVETARTLRGEGAKLFAVATSDEAEQLLREVDGIEVLCLGRVGVPAMERLIARGMPLTLYSRQQGAQISEAAKKVGVPANVHIKVDTGLHRLGFDPQDAADAVAALCADGYIKPCGLYTHLAIHNADADHVQVEKLCAVRAQLHARGIDIPFVHAVDSIGMVRYPDLHLNGARTGAWLYGVGPLNASVPCLNIARFCARVSQVRRVAAGELIGYDDDHPLTRDSIVASVSAGYIDGTPRRCVGWQVEVRGMRADALGLACMDQMMIDVTDIPGVEEGDIVTFSGGLIPNDEYSRMGDLNHNEAWARIGRRVPRVYFEQGKPVKICTEL